MVTGGSFAAGQDSNCVRDDTTHVTCTDLGNDRNVDFRVDSTAGTAHDVGIALRVPMGYDDPSTANNGDSINVTPGIRPRHGSADPGRADPGRPTG